MSLYDHPRYLAFAQAIHDAPGDTTTQLILADWLRDHDAGEWAARETVLVRRLSQWDVWYFGSGCGVGRGIGRGRGIGSGSGSGSGGGGGSGRGSGIGSGRGSGSGSGIGSGSGSGSGIGIKGYKVQQMRIGKSYLVHCGDWHTFVGRVVDQIGPQTYEMEAVSKIAETNNGDCWNQLAAGDKRLREAATYKHFKGRCPVPLAIFATEWEGDLPQEAGYPG